MSPAPRQADRPSPQLDPQELMAAARRATGLEDFGADASFLAGLRALIESCADPRVPPAAIQRLGERIVNFLSMRLRLVEDEKRHPEILEVDIIRPLIVVGQPRSGTTITVDLLGCDPALRYARDWEWYLPWPATEAATIDSDPRIALIQAGYSQLVELDPTLAGIDRFDCNRSGECNTGMMYHFASSNFWAEMYLPRYADWMSKTVPEGQYRSHKRLLQQMQWKGPKGRWLLKSPQHLYDLPALLETYPDARIVWTHRDPVLAFSSLSSYLSHIYKAVGMPADPHVTGEMVSKVWGQALLNGVAARDRSPAIDAAIYDLPHRDIARDPVAAVRGIYAHFDEPVSDAFLHAVAAFLAHDQDAQRLGKHRHRPEDFGIDRAAQERRLAPYFQRFGDLAQ